MTSQQTLPPPSLTCEALARAWIAQQAAHVRALFAAADAELQPEVQFRNLARAMSNLPALPSIGGDALPHIRMGFRAWYLRRPLSDRAKFESAVTRLGAVLNRSGAVSAHEFSAAVVSMLVDRTLPPKDRLKDLDALCPDIATPCCFARTPAARNVLQHLRAVMQEHIWAADDASAADIGSAEARAALRRAKERIDTELDLCGLRGLVQHAVVYLEQRLRDERVTPPTAFSQAHAKEVEEWVLGHVYVEAALCSMLVEAGAGQAGAGEAIDEHRIRQALASLQLQQ